MSFLELLGEKTADQMLDYSEKLGCYYMIMTNGTEAFCYHYDMTSGQYVEIESLPPYHEMLQGEFTYKKPMKIPERLTWKEIMEEGGWREYMGSGKVNELRMFVEDRMPELVSGKQFFFGKLTNDCLWNLDDPGVKKLIQNLISYALIRDEYRMFVKENAACQNAD